MPDIMIVLACLSQCLDATTLRHLTRVTEAILSMTGRVTMRGIARWSGQGGSYRTVQRFFNTTLSWCQLQWLLIRTHLLDEDDVIVAAGDDVVTTKSGKTTHGLDRFFGNFHEPRKVVNSLSGSIAGMARRRRNATVRQSCLQHEPIRVKMQ
jgi:putative transposase